MKRITAALAAGTIGVVGFGLAVPALASTGSPAATASTSKLTDAQTRSIESFLADHPRLAQALAGRAAEWQKLITAHPEIQAELTKVLAMPADQRKAELKKWLAANPAAKEALQAYRTSVKEQRLTKQKDRIEQRLNRLNGKGSGSGSGGSSTGGAAFASGV
jgi:hemophore-related protein